MSVDIGGTLTEFETSFGRKAEAVSVAPGRVNLIGEHTDYNQGFVLPVAIDRTVAVAAARRDDSAFAVRSLDYGEDDGFAGDPARGPEGSWKNYVRGVVCALESQGHRLAGADLVISGDIPRGAGLSSSAAIEVAVVGALGAVSGIHLPLREVAHLSRWAENEFVGVPCGIMDQFASALSRADHALLLDCRSLDVEHVALPFVEQRAMIVVVDSQVPRRLADTAYSQRQQECGVAAGLLGVESLRESDERLLEDREVHLPGPLFRRARHVITENTRVLAAVDALRAGELNRFGQLMCESHASLRDDFEVSCRELDLLVELASQESGVLGARLTGAGFGGCTVNLIRGKSIEGFRDRVVSRYRNETGLPAEMHVCRPVGGLRVTHV